MLTNDKEELTVREPFSAQEIRYLKLLRKQYRTIQEASSEVAHLRAVLRLPKGTEHFLSDLHGEHAAFLHILHNASGVIKRKINDLYGDLLSGHERDMLSTLIYYPDEKLALLKKQGIVNEEWYRLTIYRLLEVCRVCSVKYTRKRVRDAMPRGMGSLMEEMLLSDNTPDKEGYYREVMQSILETGQSDALIIALSGVIQTLAIDRLHIIGDIFDRGPRADLIMDALENYHQVDVQWGNHDILWMGAAAGSPGSVANVVRICARYGNLSILEDAYGINLRDPCTAFALKGNPGLSEAETRLTEKIQKAMAVIQFKVEAALIAENPSFGLDDRNLLHLIDHERGTVMVDGVEYELLDTTFPTVDWDDPYRLTEDEDAVIEQLCAAFTGSERLQRHMRFFLDRGSLYKIENGNLMLHACVPLAADGLLLEVTLFGKTYQGRALYDMVDASVRAAFSATDEAERKRGLDMLWYLWLGPGSPLFAKSKMATFELYLIADKAARKEVKNPFYSLLDDEAVVDGIFRDFGMDPATSRIICGHVPVKVKDGEDPVKANGRVLCIDGGFSAAYQKTTGLAGFTLVSNAEGLFLDANEPLASRAAAVEGTADIRAERRVLAAYDTPRTVADTDEGARIRERIALLRTLL